MDFLSGWKMIIAAVGIAAATGLAAAGVITNDQAAELIKIFGALGMYGLGFKLDRLVKVVGNTTVGTKDGQNS